jgi:hypothetical protein
MERSITVINHVENVKSFLTMTRIGFDRVVPVTESVDLGKIKVAVCRYLIKSEMATLPQPQYIIDQLDDYYWECCGFKRKGREFLCFNFFNYDPFDFGDEEPMDDFTYIMDGGADVVCCVYDVDAHEVQWLQWNGEA